MRNLSLNIAAIVSALSAILCIVMGVVYVASGAALLGLSMIFVGTPVCIGLAVVFDFVGESIRRDQIEGNYRSKKDVVDTPWEDNPDYNPNPSEDKPTRKYNPNFG